MIKDFKWYIMGFCAILVLLGFFIGDPGKIKASVIAEHLARVAAKERAFIEQCAPESDFINREYLKNGFSLKAVPGKSIVRLIPDSPYYPYAWDLCYDGGGFNSHGYKYSSCNGMEFP